MTQHDNSTNAKRQAISLHQCQIQQGVSVASGQTVIAPSPFLSPNDDYDADDDEEVRFLLSDGTSKAALTREASKVD